MVQAIVSADDGFVLDDVRTLSNSGTTQPTSEETSRTVEGAFTILKSRPTCKKKALVTDYQVQTSAALLEEAVRHNLRTGCQSRDIVSGSCNLFEWNDEETLEEFMNRVYKQSPESSSSQQINISDLRAKVLAKHAKMEIHPTDKISDHLYLYCGRGFKILYVFSGRGFLEDSLSNLESSGRIPDLTTAEALNQGCLPPSLIVETLRTLDLLFPPLGDSGSHKFLKSWVYRHKLDERLLTPWQESVNMVYEESWPRRLRELYQQYPFWAPQLFELAEEVNDPSPVTRWDRYAKRRRSQTQMYKCAFAALMVAAISGVLATILAVVQVWIAYEAWQEEKKDGTSGQTQS